MATILEDVVTPGIADDRVAFRSKGPLGVATSPSETSPDNIVEKRAVESRDLSETTRRNLRVSTFDAFYCSVMTGIAEQFFSAFCLAFGFYGGIGAGLLASIPMVVGATVQLGTPWATRQAGTYRRWVLTGASAQVVSLLVLALSTIIPGLAGIGVAFLGLAGYWASGQSTDPAWNLWMERLVPQHVRARYFGFRNRVRQFATLLGFVFAGFMLYGWSSANHPLETFGLLFILAAGCRVISVAYLALQDQHAPDQGTSQNAISHVGHSGPRSRSNSKLIWYLFAMQVAVQISGPYFAPFMIRHDGANYLLYMLLMAVAFVAKAVASRPWGLIAQRIGARRLLWLGGILVSPIAGLWIAIEWIPFPVWSFTPFGADPWTLDTRLVYLCVVQVASGVSWAAYELAISLLLLDGIPRSERLNAITRYNFLNSVALAIGTAIGAGVLFGVGDLRQTYFVLFLLSTVGRTLVALGSGVFSVFPSATMAPYGIPDATIPASGLPRADYSKALAALACTND